MSKLTIDSIISVSVEIPLNDDLSLNESLLVESAVASATYQAKGIKSAFALVSQFLNKNSWERYSEADIKTNIMILHLANMNRKARLLDESHVAIESLSKTDYETFMDFASKAIVFGKSFEFLKSGAGKGGGIQLTNNFNLISQKTKQKYSKLG